MASLVTTITRSVLSEEQVDAWGWRVPFLFSLLLAPFLYHIVKNTEESKFWEERNEQKETEQLIRENEHSQTPAVVDLLSSPFRRRQLAGMIGMLSTTSSSFYTIFLWTPVYLSRLRGLMKEKDADLLNFVVVACYIPLLLLAGKLSDKFQHRMDLVRIGLPGLIITAPTMFGMFESESWFGYLFAQLAFVTCLALVNGNMAAWEVELWMADPTLSFTGVAIGHNVASTLFGGTMPLVATFLFYRSDSLVTDDENDIWPRIIPGLYLSCLGLLSLYCISFVVRHPHDVRIADPRLKQVIQRQTQQFRKAKKEKMKRKKNIQENPDGKFSVAFALAVMSFC